MKIKVRLADQHCPLNKWLAVSDYPGEVND